MSSLPDEDGRRKYPPLRPLTPAEQEMVLAHEGLMKKEAARIAGAMLWQRAWVRSPALHQQYFEELVDAGWLALCQAVQVYNPALGNAFSTFAYPLIRGAIGRASQVAAILQKGRLVQGIKTRLRKSVLLFSEHGGDRKHADNSEERLFDIWDSRTSEQEEEVETTLPRDLVVLLSFLLTKREVQILQWRVLEGLTLAETGKREGVTRERIRQIEQRAFKKLRESRGFMQALQAQLHRRRQDVSAQDFFGINIATPVA